MGRMIRVLAVLGLLVGMLASAVPVGAAGTPVYRDVWVSDDAPAQNNPVTVFVSLCNDYDCYSPRVGVHVNTRWNYLTSSPQQDGYTDYRGVAAITRYISGATIGHTVSVDIEYVNSLGYWQTMDVKAYFTTSSYASYTPAYSPSYSPSYSVPSYSPQPTYPTYGGAVGDGKEHG